MKVPIKPLKKNHRISAAILGYFALCLSAPTGFTKDNVDFNRDVLPILAENCFQCHGPDAKKQKAGLRLDTVEGATRKLKSGFHALVPGKPRASSLIERIHSTDSEEQMPPVDSGKKLSGRHREVLRQWIAEGAPYEAHWAFEPIAVSDPPVTANSPYTQVDQFILASLREKELSLSRPLTKQQLIRRATFDLTGLPPTWEDVESFLDDSSPDAFEKVIDRLLGSPAYGERWGRHWLDLARYADTHGASAIGFRRFPFSYTYRDYVIAAFNEDLPYDRFILEQLAADQLSLKEDDPTHAALGFLTIGRQFRNVHDRIDDQIDVVSRGLLGLTVSCARCHDHKFDPIPTSDYYSLHAVFSSSSVPNDLPIIRDSEIPENYEVELKKREQLRDDIFREQEQVLQGRLRMQVGMYLIELAKGVPEQDTSTTFLSYRTEDLRPVILERWRRYLNALDKSDPVFGPWHQLQSVEKSEFQVRCAKLIAGLKKENGDPKKFADEHRLSTKPPKWNPRILDALAEGKPTTFVEAARIYGEVFGKAHREWMTSLLDAAIEASPGGELISDQDARHRIINSSIERQLRHHLYGPDSPISISLREGRNRSMMNRGVRDAVGGTDGAIHNLNLTANAPPRAMILKESTDADAKSFVFLRGNPVQRGEPVVPRFLSILSPGDPIPFSAGQRRLDLARAIVDPRNPLTRRVIVNWVWQHHFGKGLVRTSDDFGTRGDPPSHPELLDFLAGRLLEDNWSIKKLHRHIMLSKVYQQSSLENESARKKDPLNHLLWRMPARKLKLESMRDALLAVSGELDASPGGRPFEESDEKAVPRRSIYAFVNRDVISPMAATFDGSDPSSCTVKRPETMVPQQTLFALNSQFIRDRAIALMKRPQIRDSSSDEERIQRIYQRVYSRVPAEDELKAALSYLGEKGDRPPGVWPQFVQALLASNEFHFID